MGCILSVQFFLYSVSNYLSLLAMELNMREAKFPVICKIVYPETWIKFAKSYYV